jgi:hypothetical protein
MSQETSKKFEIVVPAELSKSDDGDWKIVGLASTGSRDLQGEVVDQNGLDLTPLDMKKGVFNWDHKKGPENIIGAIDSYKKNKDGLVLSGRLFKNHNRAKAVYEIMSSLNKSDYGRMGMSIEGVIKERAGKDGKVIKKAVIHSCALTMNPVNIDTHATLLKSLDGLEFTENEAQDTANAVNSEVQVGNVSDQPLFSANQVLAIVEKALGIGAGQALPPGERSGGDALVTSNMKPEDEKKKKKEEDKDEAPEVKKSLKPGSKEFYKSNMILLLDRLQNLYPEASRSELWEAVRDRLETSFTEIKA